MFKLNEIKELIKLVDQSSLQELEIQNEGFKLFLRKPGKTESVLVSTAPLVPGYGAPIPTPTSAEPQVERSSAGSSEAPAATPSSADIHTVVSPMVGTFYSSPSPDTPSFVGPGSKVTEKTVVCIIEAMKLMNEIEAEAKGEIVEVLVDNGQLVEYGQPLFLMKKQ
ncbi:acetyl-CoA carboxylase biotin carboxyl carrier protein [Gorillibacterium timonense]|uniref:acetyl-CoA carboxylase biotin carboxyl carrier protein n=1 Tax=Gorillibacterium timonense TaxID=1689269 RepID=UPI00071C4D28|nr:acetyl-CoA carboxylase biotin carboxyl carrier protein [Gorillibacterium timonense]